MLDTFIERWLGPVLVVAGISAVAYAVVGFVTTPQLEIPAEGPVKIIYGQRDPRDQFMIWGTGGVALFSIGVRLVQYFRAERLSAERSA